MPGALVGAATCGRCGAPVQTRSSSCPACGIALLDAAPGAALGTYSGLLAGVAPASPVRRRLAPALDLVLLALLLIPGIVLLTTQARAAGAFLLVAAVALVLLQLGALASRGRTVGRRMLRLRSVDDLTGMPVRSGLTLLRHLLLGGAPGTLTADLAAGRDPLDTGLEPLEADALGAEITRSKGRRRAEPVPAGSSARTRTVVLALDSGVRLEVETSLLLGRTPVNPDGAEHPVYAWPDLSRSMSKTHALLEWDGSILWVTDLDSSNGTRLVGPDDRVQPLVAGLRGPAGPGWTVRFGDRSLVVHAGPVEL